MGAKARGELLAPHVFSLSDSYMHCFSLRLVSSASALVGMRSASNHTDFLCNLEDPTVQELGCVQNPMSEMNLNTPDGRLCLGRTDGHGNIPSGKFVSVGQNTAFVYAK